MKFNWGAGIIALYASFVVMILALVGMSATQKMDMVTEHYYEEELQFQDKIDQIKRTSELPDPLTWEVLDNGLRINYPKNKQIVKGVVKLYCPSNDKYDRSFEIDKKNNSQFIGFETVPEGNYRLQINWKSGNLSYWNEDVIVVKHPEK